MRFLYAAIALSAFQAYTCAATENGTGSTAICESCPTTTSTSHFVTRTSAPKTSCPGPALTVIPNAGGLGSPSGGSGSPTSGSGAPSGGAAPTGGSSTQPTAPAFTGAGNRMVGSVGGAMAVALAAVYIL